MNTEYVLVFMRLWDYEYQCKITLTCPSSNYSLVLLLFCSTQSLEVGIARMRIVLSHEGMQYVEQA